MNGSEKNEKMYHEIEQNVSRKNEINHNEIDQSGFKLYHGEKTDIQQDWKTKMIYDRFRAGRTIIMDDLRYLSMRDPEGCKKLTESIIKTFNNETEPELQETAMDNQQFASIDQNGQDTAVENDGSMNFTAIDNSSLDEIQYTNESLMDADQKADSEITTGIHGDILDSLVTAKEMLVKMDEKELSDLLDNLNEVMELKKLNDKIRFWDDAFSDKMIMYTYEASKEFERLA